MASAHNKFRIEAWRPICLPAFDCLDTIAARMV
jgi:hypothetical protein